MTIRSGLSAVSAAVALSALTGCLGDVNDTGSETSASNSALSTDPVNVVRKGSAKCLDVNAAGTAAGTKIQQWTCNSTVAQAFVLEDRGNGAVRLRNPNSNLCAALASSSNANGTGIQLATCSSSNGQAFRVTDVGGGYSHLVNVRSGKCLDVNGNSGADGAKVQIWTCNSSDAQSWQTRSLTPGGGDGDGDDTGSNLVWRKANLTNFTSYPDPGSEECIEFSGCEYEGQFAFVDGQMSEEWVASHNIAAVHSKDANKYKLKTLRLKKGDHQIDVKVYDMCSDSDCDGCCTENASETGFLIDIESYTAKKFGVEDGIVDWACIDC